MSARALAELEAEQRRAGLHRIDYRLARFKRFRQLYAEGLSDGAIAEAMGIESRQTILWWRQLLTLDVGNKAAGMGRMRKRVRELMEALR